MTYHIERTDDMVAVTIAGKASATITLTEDGWRELAEAVLEYITPDDSSDDLTGR